METLMGHWKNNPIGNYRKKHTKYAWLKYSVGCQVGGPSRDTGLKLCKEAPTFIKAFLLSGILTLHSMLSLSFTYFRPDTVTLILNHECKIKKYVGAFMVNVFYFSVLLATSLACRTLVEQLCKNLKQVNKMNSNIAIIKK